MTYTEALDISRNEGRSVRHPDMMEGHTVRFSLLLDVIREHPSGKITKFRPGEIEAERKDWYVAD